MAGQVWAVNTLGGYMSARHLSKELRTAVQPLVKFRQFADAKPAGTGKKKGDLFHWDVFSDVATQGGTLVETNTMPETQYTIAQGTLTLGELGNSVPFSQKLDNLSELPVREIINKVLKNDAKKALDVRAWLQFNQTPLRCIASSGTDTASITLYTNGTVTGTNNIAFNNGHCKSVVDTMKERNIPPYVNDDYYAIGWPSTFRAFKNNLETLKQYSDTGFKMIMNGEIGRYENTRFVEQTNIAKGTGTDGTTTTAWTNGKSDWIFFMGDDTVMEGIAVPEEVRGKIPTDFGRSQGVAWYYLGGFGLAQTVALQARILKWDSQA